MEIKYHGQACFSIEDGGVRIVTDPFKESIGLKLPASLKADAVLISHDADPYNNAEAVAEEPRVFNWPGEYETKGVHFKLIHSFHNAIDDAEQLENNISVIHFNGIRLCHLGAQGTKLTPEQLEKVGDIDILFVPVGGKGTVDAKKAKEIIEQIEPRVVIPMCYAVDGNNLDLAPVESFTKEMGASVEEPVDVFKVKKSELPDDNSKTVIINVVS